jgi:hypothetical protein
MHGVIIRSSCRRTLLSPLYLQRRRIRGARQPGLQHPPLCLAQPSPRARVVPQIAAPASPRASPGRFGSECNASAPRTVVPPSPYCPIALASPERAVIGAGQLSGSSTIRSTPPLQHLSANPISWRFDRTTVERHQLPMPNRNAFPLKLQTAEAYAVKSVFFSTGPPSKLTTASLPGS